MAKSPKTPAETPPPDKSQAERFKEAARQAGMDESGEAFEKAFAKIVPPRRPDPGAKRG